MQDSCVRFSESARSHFKEIRVRMDFWSHVFQPPTQGKIKSPSLNVSILNGSMDVRATKR